MTQDNEPAKSVRLSWDWFFLVLGIGLCFGFYIILYTAHISQSAALYIGLPIVLASGMALQPKAKSSLGATMKALTIALLLSAPILQEGFICIIMASPILYGVAGAIASSIDQARKEKDNRNKLQAAAIVTVFTLLAMEGTHPSLTFERVNNVTYETVLEGTVPQILERLARTPTIESSPFLTQLFPQPKISGSGLAEGNIRRFDFSYNMWLFTNYKQDHVTFKVAHADATNVRFVLQDEASYLKKYIGWQTADVHLVPVDDTHTKVTTTIRFERKIDPAWYVQPLQRFYVGQAAKILTNTLVNKS